MNPIDLMGFVVCIGAVLVASRRITTAGKVGWFFLTAAAKFSAALGGLAASVANGSVNAVAAGGMSSESSDWFTFSASSAGAALMFYLGDEKSGIASRGDAL